MNNFSFSNFSNAACVNNVALPAAAPGASNSAFRAFTFIISIPGTFLAAFANLHSFEITIKGPVVFLYFLPLNFPLPALILFFPDLSNSLYVALYL